MSDTAYTPGPWKVEHRKVYGAVGQYITRDVEGGENDVCRMDGSTHAAIEQSANARLIAAAPELVEALERILGDEEVALSRPDYVFAHDVLARAKGGAS